MNAFRALAGVSLAGLCAIAAGCGGDDVPSDAVAKVGDTVITKQQFDHWYQTAASGQAQSGGPGVVPDPPRYAKCVAALKKQQPKGAPAQKDSALKKQCKDSYDQLKQQVMQFLIQAEWVQQEAADQGLAVKDAEVRSLFEDQKKRAFPKEKDYRKYLRTSGSNERDILFRVKLDAIQKKLAENVQKDQEKVSDEDIEEYYEKNKQRFTQPEQRDLNIVLTKTEGKAEEAKKALEDGQSFKAVSKEYSIDQASKAQGGKLPGVARGRQDKAFDDAVFEAKQGELEGPVKTQFGWYVFEVTRITEKTEQSLDDAKDTIRNVVKQENQSKALQDFIEDFREDYKDKTACREGFIVPECANAPEDETQTGPASGGAPGGSQAPPTQQPPPQQAPPQQAPPQQAPPQQTPPPPAP
jgi:foldase protein PrsA